jgi:ATP-dependent protease ClpP protease subunit
MNSRIVNKANSAEIYIYDDVGPSSWGLVGADWIKDELAAYGKELPVNVYLNSNGGDVFEGIAIYNLLKRHPGEVTVHVDGLAASIASLIAMAGDEIIMNRNTQLMIHKPWAFTAGNADELRKLADLIDKTENDSLVSVYRDRTGLDQSVLADMLLEETWLSAEEALELGFITKIHENKSRSSDSVKSGNQRFDPLKAVTLSDNWQAQARQRALDLADMVSGG